MVCICISVYTTYYIQLQARKNRLAFPIPSPQTNTLDFIRRDDYPFTEIANYYHSQASYVLLLAGFILLPS